jgi:hypothetical protein
VSGGLADPGGDAIRGGLLRDRGRPLPFRARSGVLRARPGDGVEAAGRFFVPGVPALGGIVVGSALGGIVVGSALGGIVVGSAGTQANASAPPMIASSMPRTNPPRLDAGNETMPSTIPAIP